MLPGKGIGATKCYSRISDRAIRTKGYGRTPFGKVSSYKNMPTRSLQFCRLALMEFLLRHVVANMVGGPGARNAEDGDLLVDAVIGYRT